MERITINNIVEFIYEAINKNLYINCSRYEYNNCINWNFDIINSKEKKVRINIFKDSYQISTDSGCLEIKYNLTERDILRVSNAYLDVVAYRESKALCDFNNFYKEDPKPIDVNDLDDKED